MLKRCRLLQLTQALENRVAQRTAEVCEANALLQHAREQRQRTEDTLRARDEEMRAISQQLWQTAKLATMGELAASVAHELNNLLATVSLRVEFLMAQVPVEDPKRRTLDVIVQEVERMGTLVANMLQFSRRSHPQISSLDVREEIENTLALVHYHLRNRHITVVQELAPEVPCIPADRQQLRQVFLHLITNASDAMPQGGTLAIHVATGVMETGAPAVVIEFTDTGGGIAPGPLHKAMEPLFTTKAEGKRTGLGWAICQRIVQECHGTFDITSAIGKGTTVRMALPIPVT